MELRALTDSHFVAPQIEPGDMAAIASQGITTVICNRPDTENPAPLQAAAMQAAAEAAGLNFVYNPIASRQMHMENVEEQLDAIDAADGPVLAYCASGTRSSIVWALSQAGQVSTDAILSACAGAGYPHEGLRPQIDALAKMRD